MGGGHDCCVPMCTSKSSTTKTVTYFSFPVNRATKRIWAKLVSRRGKNGELWMPRSESAKVCSLHFLESDFRYWATYRRLLPNALPSVFPQYPSKLRLRQAKIIENFRKNHPLGVVTSGPTNQRVAKSKGSNGTRKQEDDQSETTGKSSVSSKRTEEDDERMNEDNLLAEDQEGCMYDGNRRRVMANVSEEVESESKNTLDETLKLEDSIASKNHSEDSKPFKKRRIETVLSSGDDSSERNFNTERSEIHKNQLASSSNEPKPYINSKLVGNSENGILGRGKRIRKPPMRLEYDSEDIKEVDKSEPDEDYTPDRSSQRRPVKILENGNSEESQSLRKIKRLQQQVKWRDEQLFNLNQKSIKEREARRKAENELEALRNSMKNNVPVMPELRNKPSSSSFKTDISSNKCNETSPLERIQDFECDRKVSISQNSGESYWAEQIRRLKREIASKDQDLESLNRKVVDGRNANVKVQNVLKPKNRFIQVLKRILEDSMEGDAKALFLLEQLEAYGKHGVTNFRMSTIKKCVEWKLLNSKGYESVRNMDLLTLPSMRTLREHIDVMVDYGVTAAEEVRLDSDLVELMNELSEDGLTQADVDTDQGSSYGFHSNKKELGQNRNNTCRTVVNEEMQHRDDMQKIVEKCRQELMREMAVDNSTDGKRLGNKEKTSGEVLHSTNEQPRKPFKLELPSGILIEEIQPADKNQTGITPEKKDSVKVDVWDVEEVETQSKAPFVQIIREAKRQVKREQSSSSSFEEDHLGMVSFNDTHHDSEQLEGRADKRERNVDNSSPRNKNNSSVKKAVVLIAEPDPTSENLINAESSDLDVMEPAPEDYMPDGEAYAEVEEAVVLEEEFEEEIVEPASEETDHLPPGCYIEEVVVSSEDE